MSERGFHCIEDDISETWLEDWAGAGLAELEAYLAKHADFLPAESPRAWRGTPRAPRDPRRPNPRAMSRRCRPRCSESRARSSAPHDRRGSVNCIWAIWLNFALGRT